MKNINGRLTISSNDLESFSNGVRFGFPALNFGGGFTGANSGREKSPFFAVFGLSSAIDAFKKSPVILKNP